MPSVENDAPTFCRCQRLQAELDERLALLDRIEALGAGRVIPPESSTP